LKGRKEAFGKSLKPVGVSDVVKSFPKSTPKIIDKDAVDHLALSTQRRGNIMTHNHHNCCHDHAEVKQLTLDDGRRAERHVSHDDSGNEVVEIFAEERRPLKMEKRIVREHKRIVAKETHETIKDGEISHIEVRSLEPEVPLQVRERIGLADHHKVVDGDYVRKEEIGKIVADSVVTGVAALMENMEPAVHHKDDVDEMPVFHAQSVVAQNVAEKKKSDGMANIVMGVILIAQLAFFGYMFLM
jgi:hypothetical protein